MKILKLAAIFLILAGGIFLALNWNSIFSSSKKDEFGKKDLIDITAKCNEIRSAWAQKDGWDEALYTEQRQDIDRKKNMKMITVQSYESVNNALRESVTNRTCEGYKSGLHKSPFSDAFLQKQYKGVQTLISSENMKDDSRIMEIVNLHRLYTAIQKFARSSHAITPHFDTKTTYWDDFGKKQNDILYQAKVYRDNPLFSEMSDVPGFQDALSESKLRSTTDRYKNSFYSKLSDQIIAHFNNVQHNQESLNLFNQIYGNFKNQIKDNNADAAIIRPMARYSLDFSSEVNMN